jgi:hypothetical protein
MPHVRMFYQTVMMTYRVCFSQGNDLIETHWELKDPEQVIAIMRAAECREHDMRQAQLALREYRPGTGPMAPELYHHHYNH